MIKARPQGRSMVRFTGDAERVSELDFPSASHVNLCVDVANVRDMVRCKQRINPLHTGVKSRRPRQTTGPNFSTFSKIFIVIFGFSMNNVFK